MNLILLGLASVALLSVATHCARLPTSSLSSLISSPSSSSSQSSSSTSSPSALLGAVSALFLPMQCRDRRRECIFFKNLQRKVRKLNKLTAGMGKVRVDENKIGYFPNTNPKSRKDIFEELSRAHYFFYNLVAAQNSYMATERYARSDGQVRAVDRNIKKMSKALTSIVQYLAENRPDSLRDARWETETDIMNSKFSTEWRITEASTPALISAESHYIGSYFTNVLDTVMVSCRQTCDRKRSRRQFRGKGGKKNRRGRRNRGGKKGGRKLPRSRRGKKGKGARNSKRSRQRKQN